MNKIYKVVWNKIKGCYVVVSEFAKRYSRSKTAGYSSSLATLATAFLLMSGQSTVCADSIAVGADGTVVVQPAVEAIVEETRKKININNETLEYLTDVSVTAANQPLTITGIAPMSAVEALRQSLNDNVAQLKQLDTKYDGKLAQGFTIQAGAGGAAEAVALNGDVAPAIIFDVAEANKGLTVARDGKTVKYGIDGSKIDLSGNSSITNVTNQLERGFKLRSGSTEAEVKLNEAEAPIVEFASDSNLIVGLNGKKVTYGLDKAGIIATLSDTFAKADAGNLSETYVTDWKEKLGITDSQLAQASAWKLKVNGSGERSVGKDGVVNFADGQYTKVIATDNDVVIDLNDTAKGKLEKIDTLEKAVKANKVQVEGDNVTGVKVEKMPQSDGSTTYQVSLDKEIKVGNISIDGAVGKGEVKGLSNISLGFDGFGNSKRAATEEQLQEAMNQFTRSMTVVKGEGENITSAKSPDKNEYTVTLKKDLQLDSVTTGAAKMNNNGIVIGDGNSADEKKVALTKDGLNNGGNRITNVAKGEAPTDAVNVDQLHEVVNGVGNAVHDVDRRVSKVGAGAAALAALHPVDFDADNKLDIAAGWGHYKGQSSAALGAFYRPDERTMFSLGGTVGNGENMINAGITFKLDGRRDGMYAIYSKVRLVKEIEQLKSDNAKLHEQVQTMQALVEKLLEKNK